MKKIGIIMGSSSDQEIMKGAAEILDLFSVKYDVTVASAHRTPKRVVAYAKNAERNYEVIIAGAGMAAHLPGVIAAYTTIPVIGVPIASSALKGFDALYSIVQMPTGVPVATVAINGAKNAAILALEILSLKEPKVKEQLKAFKKKQ